MRFRDLGPLLLETDGVARPLHGRRLEAVLAALVVHADGVVSPATIIECVWGAAPPSGASGALDSLVWRLRRVLEPDRAAREESRILRNEQGYRLLVPAASIDSRAFAQAAADVSALTGTGDLPAVVVAADRALALWRGQPYAGIVDTGWLDPLRTRLEELHIGIHQQRIDALLGTGRPERALAEVVPLLAEHPFHERMWGQRMLGLYLGGRQAKALQTFQEIRRVLGSQLGIEPGPQLVELHRQILAQDRCLDAHPAAGVIAAGADAHLPRRRYRLIGRDHDREQVRARLREHRLSTVVGPVGCGKTRLAVDVAHDARNDFTGVWFVDLSEVTDPTLVADRIATTVGVVSEAGADAIDTLVAFLANRTVLLVLDNCEQVVESVAATVDILLDAAAGLVVLATSREPLDVADEALWTLRPLALPSSRLEAELSASPAVALFVARLHRPVDLAGPDGPIIADICATVDGLPLGIELAAARARAFELYEIAEGLQRDPDAISGPGRGNGRRLTLHEGIEWSHRLISTEEQIAHRRLSVLPRQFTLAAAAAVCGVAPLSSRQAPDLLARLVHRSLLAPIGPARRGGATRFSQLVPIRAHAADALRAAHEDGLVAAARNVWVVHEVAAGPRPGRSGQADWYDWLDDNHATISATFASAWATAPTADMVLTVSRLVGYWEDRMHTLEAMRWLELAARVTGVGEFAAAAANAAYGSALALNQQSSAARPHLEAAMAVLARPDADRAVDAADLLVFMAAAAWAGDDWPLAARAAAAARAVGERFADPHAVCAARAVGAAAELLLGRPEQAVTDAQEVLICAAEAGNDVAALFAVVTLGVAALLAGNPDEGLRWTGEILRCQLRLGVRNVGDTLEQRGTHYARAEQPLDALRCYAAAQTHQVRVGRSWPRHPGTEGILADLQGAVDAADYDRAWQSGQRLGIDELSAELA